MWVVPNLNKTEFYLEYLVLVHTDGSNSRKRLYSLHIGLVCTQN